MNHNRKNFKTDKATGFGVNPLRSGRRFYKKDGSANIVRKGVRFLDELSWYHTMLSMPRVKFWTWLVVIYITINLIFASIYYIIGVEHLAGIELGSGFENFLEAFFFSAQTFTTVGYGRISPLGLWTNAIAAFEAFLGVLSFALTSGLFYGRFAKPRPFLKFSHMALISPHKDGTALMFRVAPYKNNHLIEAEVKLTLSMRVNENGEQKNVFYPLDIEFDKVNTLVLNWTIVHPITENSPMYGLSLAELKNLKTELLVFLKAYDEVFANTVVARTSYIAEEFIEKAKFKPMYYSSKTTNATVLELNKLNDFEILR